MSALGLAPGARILVTGGSGRVGRAIVRELVDAGYEVVALDRVSTAQEPASQNLVGDLRDPRVVQKALAGVRGVVHAAGMPHPDYDPRILFTDTTSATFSLLWAASDVAVERCVLVSSIRASGTLGHVRHPLPARFPISEDDPARVSDAYAMAKAVDESILEMLVERTGASAVAIRLPLVVDSIWGGRLRERAWSNPREDTGSGWTWIDVDDAARAVRRSLEAPFSGLHHLLVAARTTFQPLPTEELIARYAATVPRDELFPGRRSPIDTSRAWELLGFAPEFDLPAGDEDAWPQDDVR